MGSILAGQEGQFMPTALIRAPRIFRSSDSRVAAVLYRYVLSYYIQLTKTKYYFTTFICLL